MKTTHRIVGIIVVTLILVIIPKNPPDKKEAGMRKLSNPAYDYCSGIMGYEYDMITLSDGGQNGMCKLPDGTACSEWDFYSGKCGSDYSWCEQQGYNLVTRNDGKDPYSPKYSVCVDKKTSEIDLVSSLSGLDDMASNDIVYFELIQKGRTTVLPEINPSTLVPASFDWRDFAGQNWITSVKDQSSCGACWAFSTVALTEAQHNIISRNSDLDLDLSEQYLISDCYEYGNCTGGIEGSTLEYIRDFGIPDEACYPYSGVDNSPCSARCPDYASRLTYLPHADWSNSYSSTDIKYILSNYGPVTIAFAAYGTNGGYFEGGTGGIYRCTDDIGDDGAGGFNHSVLAVGYNDAGGYWIAKNSWGSAWNGNGYFKLGYNECNVENSQISWTQSSLPITYNHFNHLPLVLKNSPTLPNPITEGFEAGVVPPAGWTKITTNPGYTWQLGSAPGSPHTGIYSAIVDLDPAPSPQDELLLSPAFTTSGGTVSLYSQGNVYWCKTVDNCDLEIWVVKGSWDAGSGDDALLGEADSSWVYSSTYALSNFNFTPYVAGGQTIKIAFRYIGKDGFQITLDDISISY